MEKEKFEKIVKRLSIFSAIAGALTILGFIFVLIMGAMLLGGDLPLGVKIFAVLVRLHSFLLFFSALRRDFVAIWTTTENSGYRPSFSWSLVLLPSLLSSQVFFGFHPRIVLVIGPMSNLGYMIAIIMIVDSIRVLREIKKASGRTN